MPHGVVSTIIKAIIVIVIIAAVVAYLLSGSNAIRTLNSNTTITLNTGQSTYFRLAGSSDIFAILLRNSTSSYVTVYISKVPVLASPIVAFSSAPGYPENVSANAGSRTANLQVKLVSSNNASAVLMLTPIPATFNIKVSGNVRIINPVSFSTSNLTVSPSITIPPVSTTTAVTANAASTTTVSPVTTVSQTSAALQVALTMANSTYIGSLVNQYKALYIKDTACTPSTYNTTFLAYRSQIPGAQNAQPVGPFSFSNVSTGTPTNITSSVYQLSSSLYLINYTVVTPSRVYTGVAVSINLNTTSGVVTRLLFTGVYRGLNYTVYNSNYKFQSGITGSCGAYIP